MKRCGNYLKEQNVKFSLKLTLQIISIILLLSISSLFFRLEIRFTKADLFIILTGSNMYFFKI